MSGLSSSRHFEGPPAGGAARSLRVPSWRRDSASPWRRGCPSRRTGPRLPDAGGGDPPRSPGWGARRGSSRTHRADVRVGSRDGGAAIGASRTALATVRGPGGRRTSALAPGEADALDTASGVGTAAVNRDGVGQSASLRGRSTAAVLVEGDDVGRLVRGRGWYMHRDEVVKRARPTNAGAAGRFRCARHPPTRRDPLRSRVTRQRAPSMASGLAGRAGSVSSGRGWRRARGDGLPRRGELPLRRRD